MAEQLVECVPNISEGRDEGKIRQVTEVIEAVEGVKLLDVDPGKATNRTVITMVGAPGPVIEAAFRLIKRASEVIDMRQHHGEHPRFGATDVCPLVPIANISMEETVEYAHKLGARVGEELGIPVYFYENACKEEKRRNLAACRSGQYEGLKDKLSDANWQPDCGPAEFNEKVAVTGATAIGARDFLVAYNINLNTTSTRRANSIAFDIREAGRVKRRGNPITGEIVKDEQGNPVRIPGKLKCVKGLGWYIEEYGIAQISYNLTNISVTPVHIAFDETCKSAESKGIRVTGSELVGLIPKKALLDAADHFLTKQRRSLGIDEEEKIKIAVKSLGLDDLGPFNPGEKVIEYLIEEDKERLIDKNLSDFVNETASESPAPGGGSVAAYCGALGAALGAMVANLSSHKRGWDDKWDYYSAWAVKGQEYKEQLLRLVDEDTAAFNSIMEAFKLPKGSGEEKKIRAEAIQKATKNAINVPLRVMELSHDSMQVMKAMAEEGLEASVSDAGVGALCARAAVMGAYLNVMINLPAVEDQAYKKDMQHRAAALRDAAVAMEQEIISLVEKRI
ncbi:MAG: glutamate formimidoyltransferase [Flavobacteriales bacterium]